MQQFSCLKNLGDAELVAQRLHTEEGLWVLLKVLGSTTYISADSTGS